MAFKENCLDLRNSKVYDLIRELENYGVNVSVHEPVADPIEPNAEYGIMRTLWRVGVLPVADAIVLTVAHQRFVLLPLRDYLAITKGKSYVS
ncbi:UDP-N-acetyl-D-galactosamine dehydrogenase [Sulfuricella sp. T08]|uniref:UDP binding domain-containing protein n=1 Tax=Sulfuricella sp. T08 TaxID=1632857 RepID=UPI0006179B18|nr:UDP binding domain-containing protein [Sulfuricella sp. T08]GAO34798.1 UDP-N-acetyl-D-galactosamine dehydrogenase [Sulfuricella sp. T08]